MNTTLKHWKEAATLIIAAGNRLVPETLVSRTPPNAATAASPLASSHGLSHLPHSSSFDYDVLLLKRSSKSGFMPNAYVFPGGMADSTDFSSEWLDIFKPFKNFPNFGLRTVNQSAETRPPMFATDRLKLGSPIPGEVAFRICALRETFEESGVLLVVSKPEREGMLNRIEARWSLDQVVREKAGVPCSSNELNKWRILVNQNPCNFLKMCRELEVLPNIWALHEWSNWLTPAGRRGVSRFDTAFFICCLQEIPHTLQDEREIVHCQWSTPAKILQSYHAREMWVAPPQFYELSRLCRFPLLDDLHSFCSQRATEGCEQWMPVIRTDEQPMSLLPGDKLYPTGETKEGASTDHHSEGAQEFGLHRVLLKDPYSPHLQITIKPKYNHLVPVIEQHPLQASKG
ncbi:uncharacterized protein V6R79_005791 [Siganus canaliculatus]